MRRLSKNAERLAWTRLVEGDPEKALRNKYRAVKTSAHDRVFDSGREAKRAVELQWLERLGKITELQYQVAYELVPAQDGEKPVEYRADFVYLDRTGQLVVEDAKGCRTPDYIIKRKLMLWVPAFGSKKSDIWPSRTAATEVAY